MATKKISKLEIWRRDKGLTQTILAAKAGLTQNKISLFERGLFPTTTELESLIAAGCPVDKIWK